MGRDFTKMTVTDHHVMCIQPTVTRYHVKRIPFEDGWLFVSESIVWCLVVFIELFICVKKKLRSLAVAAWIDSSKQIRLAANTSDGI